MVEILLLGPSASVTGNGNYIVDYTIFFSGNPTANIEYYVSVNGCDSYYATYTFNSPGNYSPSTTVQYVVGSNPTSVPGYIKETGYGSIVGNIIFSAATSNSSFVFDAQNPGSVTVLPGSYCKGYPY